MAIEDIFRALEEQAEDDIRALMGGARSQAAGIAEDADKQAEEVHRRMVSEAESAARTSSMHKLNAARLAAKKRVAAVKGGAIDEVFDAAKQRLADARSNASYPKLFETLLDEALENVEGERAVVVDARDSEIAERLAGQRGVRVETGIQTAGGVVVSTHDGRVSRRNTLEDRLEKLRHTSRSDIAEILLQQ